MSLLPCRIFFIQIDIQIFNNLYSVHGETVIMEMIDIEKWIETAISQSWGINFLRLVFFIKVQFFYEIGVSFTKRILFTRCSLSWFLSLAGHLELLIEQYNAQ